MTDTAKAALEKILGPLDGWIATNVIEGNIPLFAFAAATHDGVVFNRIYKSSGQVLTPSIPQNPLFDIGSISKTITVTAILRLVDRGALKLNDRFLDFFPEIAARKDSPLGRTTVRDMMRHQTPLSLLNKKVKGRLNLSDEQLVNLLQNSRINGHVRGQWSYSNMNIAFLGMIAERVTGKSYAEFVKTILLQPFNFQGLYPSIQGLGTGERKRIVTGHDLDVKGQPITLKLRDRQAFNAAGGYVATADGVARFFHETLSGHVLSRRLTRKMTGDSFEFDPRKHWRYSLGLNHFPMDRHGGTDMLMGHAGNRPGFCSVCAHSPSLGLTFSMMTNAPNLPPDDTHDFRGHTFPMPLQFGLFRIFRQAAADIADGKTPVIRPWSEPLRRADIPWGFNPEICP